MKCIYCGHPDSKVLDSRNSDENNSIRRRRECLACLRRFTTYETVESTPIMVIKNGGNRQPFDPAKIKRGIIKACEKRPVPVVKIDALVADIERVINNSLNQEIPSAEIGEMVMERLKGLDGVAYVRFAAVYKQFKDLESFTDFIERNKKDEPQA
jgi:transcriptional repressor NrdR